LPRRREPVPTGFPDPSLIGVAADGEGLRDAERQVRALPGDLA
jgi:hypothetical protein